MNQQVKFEKPSPSTQDYLAFVNESTSEHEKTLRDQLELDASHNAEWYDPVPSTFTASQRAHTTILHSGLTVSHDLFIQSGFRGMGYKVQAMDVPDNKSLQFGREFGNRGQCNPTYYTVGNLVKKLLAMEAEGIPKADIISNYVFATVGSCGPCRFGTYVTEYRKALRDAGFEGFRVILFQQSGGVKQATGEDMGLEINIKFFLTMVKAVILGDILNAHGYRIRPYELNAGETDAVIERAKKRIARAFETHKGFWKALIKTRREFNAIQVDRTRIKPKVAIIGEFWAMTTEGDGNYKMHRFLEKEGAEVDIQTTISWPLYLLWAAKYDTIERAKLKGADKALNDQDSSGSKFALENVNVGKRLLMLRTGEQIIHTLFKLYAKVLGLKDLHLPDMKHIAEISHSFYDNNLRGGEGHMEVGKLIHNVVDQKVNMTLSIKPFGCMPSSAVSDGVQSLITELYPTAIFLPIETNGDGAVNVYSRVQMQLFKARQTAEKDVNKILNDNNWTQEDFVAAVKKNPHYASATYRSAHKGACTAVDLLSDVLHKRQPVTSRAFQRLKNIVISANTKQRATLNKVNSAAKKYKHAAHDSLTHNGFAHNNVEQSIVKIVDPA